MGAGVGKGAGKVGSCREIFGAIHSAPKAMRQTITTFQKCRRAISFMVVGKVPGLPSRETTEA